MSALRLRGSVDRAAPPCRVRPNEDSNTARSEYRPLQSSGSAYSHRIALRAHLQSPRPAQSRSHRLFIQTHGIKVPAFGAGNLSHDQVVFVEEISRTVLCPFA